MHNYNYTIVKIFWKETLVNGDENSLAIWRWRWKLSSNMDKSQSMKKLCFYFILNILYFCEWQNRVICNFQSPLLRCKTEVCLGSGNHGGRWEGGDFFKRQLNRTPQFNSLPPGRPLWLTTFIEDIPFWGRSCDNVRTSQQMTSKSLKHKHDGGFFKSVNGHGINCMEYLENN